MTRRSWMMWVLLVGLLWIFPVSGVKCSFNSRRNPNCIFQKKTTVVVADKFYASIKASKHVKNADLCIMFLKTRRTLNPCLGKAWPQLLTDAGSSPLLYLSAKHMKKKSDMYLFLHGKNCTSLTDNRRDDKCSSGTRLDNGTEKCKVMCLNPQTTCDSAYNKSFCSSMDKSTRSRYVVDVAGSGPLLCRNCNAPVKKPDGKVKINDVNPEKGKRLDPATTAKVMRGMKDLALSINGSSATVSGGEGVTGVILKLSEPEDVEEVSFAFDSSGDELQIVEREYLSGFSRSITLSQEALEKAFSSDRAVAFAAVVRFLNMAEDELHNILGNEVIGIETGTNITNLTEEISISFWNVKEDKIPSCQSWNGEGGRPNWTSEGCRTVTEGDKIMCLCSHLTFFAILLTPLNQTISSADMKNLTIITKVGCGISMFFLGIILFMYLLVRKTKATNTMKILIQLVSAMLLLNTSFLVNGYVADLKNPASCTVMAAFMNYSLLATFTWFATQAFHLLLQMRLVGNVGIRFYLLKVSVVSWAVPGVAVIALLIAGKYGEDVVRVSDAADSASICWITDSDAHYVVNIGYYALVFVFTFTTFIVMSSWLLCLKRTQAVRVQRSGGGVGIVTIFGLCCMLGITWGTAFFAHGILRIFSYYVFTCLNSFQGFCLFIYYYYVHTANQRAANAKANANSSTTLNTGLDKFMNPYARENTESGRRS